MRCKFCNFACTNQEGLFKHYHLRHGGGANWPCIYSDCVCTFRTHGALKTHLTRSHCRTKRRAETCTFFCESCEFRENCTQHTFFSHLAHHLRNRQTVHCPFSHCEFKTNNLKTFTSHRSRKHKQTQDIRTCIRENVENVCAIEPENVNQPSDICVESETSQTEGDSNDPPEEEYIDTDTVEHKIASLFVRMQTVFQYSEHECNQIDKIFSSNVQI